MNIVIKVQRIVFLIVSADYLMFWISLCYDALISLSWKQQLTMTFEKTKENLILIITFLLKVKKHIKFKVNLTTIISPTEFPLYAHRWRSDSSNLRIILER